MENVWIDADSCDGWAWDGTATDLNGAYEIDGLASGGYRVRAHSYDYITEFYGGARDWESATCVSVTEGQNTPDIDISLDAGATISGTVVDAGGNPMEDARVSAIAVDGSQGYELDWTESDGSYSLKGLPTDDYIVDVSADGYVHEYYDDAIEYDDAISVHAVEGQETGGIDFSLETGGIISGSVSDVGGQAIQGAWVVASPADGVGGSCSAPISPPNPGGGSCVGYSDCDGAYSVYGLAVDCYMLEGGADGCESEYYLGEDGEGDPEWVCVADGEEVPARDFVLGDDNCQGMSPNPVVDNGLDDDQDGEIDEGCEQPNVDGACIENGIFVPDCDITVPSGDTLGDACDDDSDNDWMLNSGAHPVWGTPGEDVGCGSGPTNPLLRDTDGDGTIDGAECLLGSDPNSAASKPAAIPVGDTDMDGLPPELDAMACPSDFDADTLVGNADPDCDGDGLSDGLELKGWGTMPSEIDSDGDGCDDDKEVADINGDRGYVSLPDLLLVAKMYFNILPRHMIADMDRNGLYTLADVVIAAKNSILQEPQSYCLQQ